MLGSGRARRRPSGLRREEGRHILRREREREKEHSRRHLSYRSGLGVGEGRVPSYETCRYIFKIRVGLNTQGAEKMIVRKFKIVYISLST